MQTDELKKWSKEMLNCTQCGFCKEVCPIFEDVGWDSSSARGKVSLCYGLYTGDINPDPSVVERLYQCTTCADCTRRCPSSTAVVDIIEAARRDVVSSGIIGPVQQRILDSVTTKGNPFGETTSRREIFGEKPHKAKVAYFTGCSAAYRNFDTAKAGISILKKLGTDYTLLDEVCCGSVLSRMGQPEEVIVEQMNANLDAIKATGADTVIFSCAGCLRMFREEYSKFAQLPFRALHFAQWLEEVDLELRPYKKTVTYHDPCHIGRHMGIYDPPRNLIGKIPGITFLEMEDSKESARCCGGGGGVRSGFPDISKQIAARRVAQAQIADVLLTTCPFCVNNLKLGKDVCNSDIEVRDLLEVLEELL